MIGLRVDKYETYLCSSSSSSSAAIREAILKLCSFEIHMYARVLISITTNRWFLQSIGVEQQLLMVFSVVKSEITKTDGKFVQLNLQCKQARRESEAFGWVAKLCRCGIVWLQAETWHQKKKNSVSLTTCECVRRNVVIRNLFVAISANIAFARSGLEFQF